MSNLFRKSLLKDKYNRGVDWPRLYFSRRAIKRPESELLEMAQGKKKIRRWLYDFWLRIKCRLSGSHYITVQFWQGPKPEDGKWHIGCIRCPLFRTEK